MESSLQTTSSLTVRWLVMLSIQLICLVWFKMNEVNGSSYWMESSLQTTSSLTVCELDMFTFIQWFHWLNCVIYVLKKTSLQTQIVSRYVDWFVIHSINMLLIVLFYFSIMRTVCKQPKVCLTIVSGYASWLSCLHLSIQEIEWICQRKMAF